MGKLRRTNRKAAKRDSKTKHDISVEELQDLTRDLAFFRTPGKDVMVRLPSGHGRVERADTRDFRDFLVALYLKTFGVTVRAAALDAFVSATLATTREEGPTTEVFVRVAVIGDTLHIDLGGDHGFIEATAKGWSHHESTTVAFTAPQNQLPLPAPLRGGNLDDLWRLLNVPERDRPLVAAWMAQAWLQDSPMALLVFEGPEGSGKSAAARMMKGLLDPQVSAVRALPDKDEDLFLSLGTTAVLAFDNVSHVTKRQSDDLCRVLSGGGMSKRELYTNAGERTLSGRRPILLNGITTGIDRPDLLSRMIAVRFPRIDPASVRTERELEATYRRLRPFAVGALLDLVVLGLANRDSVIVPNLPRLADFAKLGAAMETGLGLEDGGFASRFASKTRESTAALATDNPLLRGILALMQATERWEGTATDLRGAVAAYVPLADAAALPPSGAAVGLELKRLEAVLSQRGVMVERPRTSEERRIILRRVRP